ncbi:MAG: type IV pilin [Methanomicrobiales archaeon]|nr:type IV pilin [Methanomicrobiales archaeon]
MGWHHGEDGASEVVGVILLVGVTVLAVAVVAVILLSGPQPDEVSHASIVARNESGDFALAHEGGDPLKEGGYRIYVDTGSGPVDRTDDFIGLTGGVWSIGETLIYKGQGTPEGVIVTAVSGGGGETILAVVDIRGERMTFDPDPVVPGGSEGFIDFVINENVFVYGNALSFSGDYVNGPGAMIILTGGLDMAGTNFGASINVSDISIDGDAALGSGSSSLGSPTDPGSIYINGNLTVRTGKRHIYGDVYVNGNCDLEGTWMYGNAFVNGDLMLRREDTGLADDARIYYTGTITSSNNVNESTLEKCIHQVTVPGFTMPGLEIPSVKSDEWYDERGYVASGALANGIKVFAQSHTSSGSATNVTIIAYDGDIAITGWGNEVTGVFFAPRGRVTFSGNSLEGVVIARDGFHVTSGGTEVTFRNIDQYISDAADYPF